MQTVFAVSIAVLMFSVIGVSLIGGSDDPGNRDAVGVGSDYPMSLTVTMNPGESLESAVSKAIGTHDTSDIGNLTVLTRSSASVTSADFDFIRENIKFLSTLNLSGAKLNNNEIPDGAMRYYVAHASPISISLPSNIARIGSYAFENTLIASSSGSTFSIPKTVTALGDYAFSGSFSKSHGSPVNTVAIPASLNSMGVNPFAYCTSVNKFTSGESGAFVAADNVLYTKDLKELVCFPAGKSGAFKVPDTVSTIRDYAFEGSQGFNGIDLRSVRNIGNYAFLNCSTVSPFSLTIPSTVMSIGDNPFSGFSTLKSISVAKGSSFYAKDGVLYDGPGMKKIISYPCMKSGDFAVPGSVETLGNSAFEGASVLGKITFSSPSSLKEIGNYAFVRSSVSGDMVFPEGLSKIGHYAFCYCANINSVTIPKSMQMIGDGAFWGSGITKLMILDNAAGSVSIGDYSFYQCGKLSGSLNLPGNVKNIGTSAFEGCSGLTSLSLAEGIARIGDHAFDNCSSVSSVTIPSTASVGSYAFARSGMTSLTISEGVSSVGSYAFFNSAKIKGTVTIPSTLSEISEGMFSDCYGITGLDIRDGVRIIGDRAFNKCSSLDGSVKIPSSVVSLGAGSFEECTSLDGVSLEQDSRLSTIMDNAFYGCRLTVTLTLPMSVTGIGSGAFENCDGLTIGITSSSPRVGSKAFSEDTKVYVNARFVLDNVDQNAFGTGKTSLIRVTWSSGGTVTPADGVLCGSDRAYTVTPDPGYEISSITVNGVSISPVSNLVIKNEGKKVAVDVVFVKSIVYYNISADSTVGGSISPSGMNRVESGKSITFSIVPDPGYHIKSVNINGVSVGTPASYTYQGVSASSAIFVEFEKDIHYTVTANAGSGGAISHPGVTSVPKGGSISFTVSADPGYHISAVTVNGKVMGALSGYTFDNISGDCTINAVFDRDIVYHDLYASAGAGGMISDSGRMSVPEGGINRYLITPDTGYHVADVIVDGSSVGPVSEYLFENVNADHRISVSFAANIYTIGISAGVGGRITGSESAGYGSDAVMTISPDPGYHIADVIVNGRSVGAVSSYTFSAVDSSCTISAVFRSDTVYYDIVATEATAGGTISPSGTTKLSNSSSQKFTITPHNAYFISDVKVNGVSVGAVSEYTVSNPSSDMTIEAYFDLEISTYTVTATEGPGGLISPLGTISMKGNGTQTFYITSNQGYHIADVKVNGVSVGAVSSYTFNGVTRDSTIDASFSPTVLYYKVTASAGPGGIITPNGANSVGHDSSLTHTISPESGYHVADVKVNGVSVGAVSSYTFSGPGSDSSIYAMFEIDSTMYNISSSAGTGGKISPAGVISVSNGSSAAYVITPSSGYAISSVIVNGVDIGAVSSYTFTDVSAYSTIRANFAMELFEISVRSNEHGTVTPIGESYIHRGGSQTVTVTADPGYHVKNVRIDGKDMGAIQSYTFHSISSDHEVAVTFDGNLHTLDIIAGPGGSVTGSGTYGYESEVMVKAFPDEGFRFVSWSDGVTDRSRSVPMDSSKTLSAVFGAIPDADLVKHVSNLPSAEETISDLGSSVRGVRYVVTDKDDFKDFVVGYSVLAALSADNPGKVLVIEFRSPLFNHFVYSMTFYGCGNDAGLPAEGVDTRVSVSYSTDNSYIADSVYCLSAENEAAFIHMNGSGDLPCGMTLKYRVDDDGAGEEFGLYAYDESSKSLKYLNGSALVDKSGSVSYEISEISDYVLVMTSVQDQDREDDPICLVILVVCGILIAGAIIWLSRRSEQ